MKKDILLFISDQHSALMQHYAGDSLVRTPNLDMLAEGGCAFMNAVTPYPLCVPARMCMMAGQLASRIDCMSNSSVLSSARATFAHSLDVAGYDTVLCGRMHFVGPDQRHGFTKRIAGDLTPFYTNRPKTMKEERGIHMNTAVGGRNSLTAIGAGNSPTLEYDRYVISHALDYLQGEYEKPQFLCVGTYAPHHPFVAPKELYDYYLDKVDSVPDTLHLEDDPFYQDIFRDRDPEVIRAVRAAYYGLVEFLDDEVGQVYRAFQAYLERTGHEGVFIYVSDHGEMAGTRGMYGKNTFYEESVHIPMIFSGDGIERGRRFDGAVSLLDIGPTICALAGAEAAGQQDGRSLVSQLVGGKDDLERMVISEVGGRIEKKSGLFSYGQMVRCASRKYVRFFDNDEKICFERMADIAADPLETRNILLENTELAEKMRTYLGEVCLPSYRIYDNAEAERVNLEVTMKLDFDHEERWKCTPAGREAPEEMVSTKTPAVSFVFP